jgi:hypothetical protein
MFNVWKFSGKSLLRVLLYLTRLGIFSVRTPYAQVMCHKHSEAIVSHLSLPAGIRTSWRKQETSKTKKEYNFRLR